MVTFGKCYSCLNVINILFYGVPDCHNILSASVNLFTVSVVFGVAPIALTISLWNVVLLLLSSRYNKVGSGKKNI